MPRPCIPRTVEAPHPSTGKHSSARRTSARSATARNKSDVLISAVWPNSLPQGKTQGISPIQPFSAKISLENICEFSSLQMNSLHGQRRELIRANRELIQPQLGINSAYQDLSRELAQNRSARRDEALVPRCRLSCEMAPRAAPQSMTGPPGMPG